ncbi:MAG: hypothetical protein KBC12_00335 [Candidatus Pacebacteria bacterium]|jgi:flagellar motor component MotA|nr:hypothetical protein [Candidatus Paceibacterota bacterium]MBP9851100.1 hypothetical protein [Candidatus Paceibacterota bacterium]
MKKFKFKIKINPAYKKYLPSKSFTIFVGGGITLVIIVSVIFGLAKGKENFSALKTQDLKTDGSTLSDLLQTDTDLDGVLDWEEALWGTDKTLKATFNATPDAIYVKQKKDALATEDDSEGLNETDKFARSFFASYLALESAGEDPETIKNLGRAVGEKIGDPNLVDVFAEGDAKVVVGTDISDVKKYYTAIQEVFDKYRETGMGDEIDIVNSGLVSAQDKLDSVNRNKLERTSKTYKDFADEMMKISVPREYISAHVKMANSAYNTGVSVLSMTKIVDDPIVGLGGITQYQKYSEDFVKAAGDLDEELAQVLEE